ncbi:hypothetical protein KFK09_016495 [Dendrobium nobile]|uniref:Uncharacterized protein n=1 Tax=Dendrobium nobile TaxID=94219 RepID=A0A8T3AZM4_DENNO|nr:hypothetical protein KFK09_016495 [Dendrobium nobile]
MSGAMDSYSVQLRKFYKKIQASAVQMESNSSIGSRENKIGEDDQAKAGLCAVDRRQELKLPHPPELGSDLALSILVDCFNL